MPGVDGLRCLESLRQRHPEVKTVVLSGTDDADVIDAAFQRGAAAFILKRIDPVDLAPVIRQALDGNVFYPVSSAGRRRDAGLGLTTREADILKALAEGLSNKQIARQFWLSEQTIKFHLTNIYRKLEVGSRTEAVRHAYEHGMIENPMLRATADSRLSGRAVSANAAWPFGRADRVGPKRDLDAAVPRRPGAEEEVHLLPLLGGVARAGVDDVTDAIVDGARHAAVRWRRSTSSGKSDGSEFRA